MEIKDLIREVVVEMIDDSKINDIIASEVHSRFGYEVDRAIKNEAARLAEERGGKYIEEKVEAAINKGVLIDNGWGKTSSYETFDNFVRQKIEGELMNNWNIERKVREATEERIKKAAKEIAQERLKGIVDEVVCDIAGVKQNG